MTAELNEPGAMTRYSSTIVHVILQLVTFGNIATTIELQTVQKEQLNFTLFLRIIQENTNMCYRRRKKERKTKTDRILNTQLRGL